MLSATPSQHAVRGEPATARRHWVCAFHKSIRTAASCWNWKKLRARLLVYQNLMILDQRGMLGGGGW